MWNKLQGTEYFINLCVENHYKIYVTDFVSIWTLYSTRQGFISSVKECNKILQMSDDSLLKDIEDMLNNTENVTSKLTVDSSVMDVALKKRTQYGYVIKLNMKLNKSSEQLFFNKVTQSLLNVIRNLKQSQNELCDTIAKKDKEISNYKMEGAKISLKYLKTQRFEESKHLSKYPEYSRTFGADDVPDILMEKEVVYDDLKIEEVETNQPMKEEPHQPVKEEPNHPVKEESHQSAKVEPHQSAKEEHNQPVKEEPNQLIKEEPPSQEPSETSIASSSPVKREGSNLNKKNNKMRKVLNL